MKKNSVVFLLILAGALVATCSLGKDDDVTPDGTNKLGKNEVLSDKAIKKLSKKTPVNTSKSGKDEVSDGKSLKQLHGKTRTDGRLVACQL
ncbi:hypothetical protein [Borrelia sp. P9F1]|uniref:hypothetical protein n=1 Tax=Borrelia sp. P9F1 TaxID=3058374 RepID=UPI0026481D88|nr:hypothetical protein [Borrelia sp. P9F1]WKC58685.1 hypothetical protein QYZ68_05635 [Borrelia sp. P9F1]